jgi:hypothetical protein
MKFSSCVLRPRAIASLYTTLVWILIFNQIVFCEGIYACLTHTEHYFQANSIFFCNTFEKQTQSLMYGFAHAEVGMAGNQDEKNLSAPLEKAAEHSSSLGQDEDGIPKKFESVTEPTDEGRFKILWLEGAKSKTILFDDMVVKPVSFTSRFSYFFFLFKATCTWMMK